MFAGTRNEGGESEGLVSDCGASAAAAEHVSLGGDGDHGDRLSTTPGDVETCRGVSDVSSTRTVETDARHAATATVDPRDSRQRLVVSATCVTQTIGTIDGEQDHSVSQPSAVPVGGQLRSGVREHEETAAVHVNTTAAQLLPSPESD
jgi:hypothetical protein